MSALAEICSNQLQNVGATRDSVRSNAQMRAALNAIGRKGTAEGVTVLKEVLAHPAAKDSVKEEALRALYRVTGKDALVRPWIDSGNDQLRATALELLAPVLIGDPSLDKTIEKMMAKWLEEYSRTRTGTVLRSIRQMREFREDYEAEKHPKKKIDLLVSNILWMCDEPPLDDEGWHIGDNVFSQYLLLEFRRIAATERSATVSAIAEYAHKNPEHKGLTEVLIRMLDTGRATETNKQTNTNSAK